MIERTINKDSSSKMYIILGQTRKSESDELKKNGKNTTEIETLSLYLLQQSEFTKTPKEIAKFDYWLGPKSLK